MFLNCSTFFPMTMKLDLPFCKCTICSNVWCFRCKVNQFSNQIYFSSCSILFDANSWWRKVKFSQGSNDISQKFYWNYTITLDIWMPLKRDDFVLRIFNWVIRILKVIQLVNQPNLDCLLFWYFNSKCREHFLL